MHRSEQRRASAPEKLSVQQTRCFDVGARRKIGSTHCGAVAGKSVHGPMT